MGLFVYLFCFDFNVLLLTNKNTEVCIVYMYRIKDNNKTNACRSSNREGARFQDIRQDR